MSMSFVSIFVINCCLFIKVTEIAKQTHESVELELAFAEKIHELTKLTRWHVIIIISKNKNEMKMLWALLKGLLNA